MSDIRKARLHDASIYKTILGFDTAKAAEAFLRERNVYVNAEATKAACCFKTSSHSVTMSFKGKIDGTFIDDLLNMFFFKMGLYKVSAIITEDDKDIEKVLTEEGFEQEAILHDELYLDGRFCDAGLFYITKPGYKRYNVGFLPFQRGIISVSGGVDYIDDITFLSYEQTPENEFIRYCAEYSGLMTDGKMSPRGDKCYEEYEASGLPAEVKRAIKQIREYLLKDRTSFDIIVNVPRSSEFRVRVWDEIKKIPYGYTKSYEDIALALTGGDIKKAVKLTRAVGHACSENPVPIIVPCHRVIGKDGRLVGFKDGVEFKDFLLTHELFAALPLN